MTSNKKKNNKLDIEKCSIPGVDAIGFNIPSSSNSAIICCICNDIIKPLMSNDVPPQIIWDKGNNAEPVKTGRCCDKCNLTEVLPARLQSINKEEFDSGDSYEDYDC